MMLPYSIEALFAAMAEINAAWFPAPLLAVLLALAAVALVLRPFAGRTRMTARIVGALLAAAWVFVGTVYQIRGMATLNFLAPIYGGVWIIEGALIATVFAVCGRSDFRFEGDLRGRVGLALALFGLAGYPLVVLALGDGWWALPVVGIAAEPTVIFTAGFLVAARDRPPLFLLAVPLAWSGVAAVQANLLRFPLDYTVPLSVLVVAALVLRARFCRTTAPRGGLAPCSSAPRR
jgi:hypothetical protein